MGAKLDIRRAGGLTMVEILVVVAIIAIMAGVAIPSFARMGLLWKNDLQSSARELYTLLTAARIYATTYNVETAVVYTTYNPDGNTPDNLRAAAMMYGYASGTEQFFRFVDRQDDGSFRSLPGETCLLSWPAADPADPPEVPGGEKVRAPSIESSEDERFRAHVFEPSGRLRKQGKELYRINVRYNDAATVDERLVDPALGEYANNYRMIGINLYRATGRVEMVSD